MTATSKSTIPITNIMLFFLGASGGSGVAGGVSVMGAGGCPTGSAGA